MIVRLKRLHTLCVQQLVYPLVLSSLLAWFLYTGRVMIAQRTTYNFLIWNLFLAWIPYACSLSITLLYRWQPRRGWLLVIPSMLWLVFLPNAPYLVTDLWHLDNRPPVPLWYDVGMLASFAWTGSFLGIVSLSQMQHVVRKYVGSLVSWLFVLGTIGLSGLGIYLGRFMNLNSWDLVLRPGHVLVDIATQFAHPISYPRPIGVTLLFAAFILVCYVTFVAIEHREYEFEKMKAEGH